MTNQQPEGTFSRLMASTTPSQAKTPEPVSPQPEEPEAKPKDKQVHARTDARTQAPTHRRTHTSTDAPVRTSLEEELFQRLQLKQRLASSTFRFQPEELQELDEIFKKLEQKASRKVSKNDLVRLGLNWLMTDYKTNGANSLLARVLARS